jgi:cytidylate kinase
VVFPTAEVKIYLTARSENRAERRALEHGLSKEDTIQAQSERDKQDSTRRAAPLQIPAGACVVDTTEMNLQEVIDHLVTHIKEKLQGVVPLKAHR